MDCESSVDIMSLVVVLIGRRAREFIRHLSAMMLLAGKTVKRDWCISIRLLLVKCLLSIVS